MSASHKLKNWVNYKFVLKICKEKKGKKWKTAPML